MEPKDSDKTVELGDRIEVGGNEPYNFKGDYEGDGADVAVDDASFDEGIDMRDLGEEEGEDGKAADAAPVDAKNSEDTDVSDEGDGAADTQDEVSKVDAPEDLGEFKADDAETVEKFTKQYYTEAGVMNLPNLYAEFEKNFAAGNPRLNEGTEAFLASRGIPKEALEDHYAAYDSRVKEAKRQAEESDKKLEELAGGRETYDAAIKWAKESGAYDDAAKRAFNKALTSGDHQARADAVELLITRYNKAVKPVDRDEPLRDATKGRGKATSGAVKPFANRKEYQEALKAAGDNMEKLRAVDARARAGGF